MPFVIEDAWILWKVKLSFPSSAESQTTEFGCEYTIKQLSKADNDEELVPSS